MRASHSRRLLIGAIVTSLATLSASGCKSSRIGALSWWKKDSAASLASRPDSNYPKPPSVSLTPQTTSTAAIGSGSGSRFNTGAPVAASGTYPSTNYGDSTYGRAQVTPQSGGYSGPYGSTGSSGYAGGAGGAQSGFYATEYPQAAGSGSRDSSTAGGSYDTTGGYPTADRRDDSAYTPPGRYVPQESYGQGSSTGSYNSAYDTNIGGTNGGAGTAYPSRPAAGSSDYGQYSPGPYQGTSQTNPPLGDAHSYGNRAGASATPPYSSSSYDSSSAPSYGGSASPGGYPPPGDGYHPGSTGRTTASLSNFTKPSDVQPATYQYEPSSGPYSGSSAYDTPSGGYDRAIPPGSATRTAAPGSGYGGSGHRH